jgi:hypothetical protein
MREVNMKKMILLALAGFAAMASGPASAGLTGDLVKTTFKADADSYGTLSSVVGAGIEGNFFGSQFFDYSDMGFTFMSSVSACGTERCSPPLPTITLRLDDLDFGPSLVLNDVQFTSLFSSVTVSFGADFAEFSWIDQSIPPGTLISAQFLTAPVPEPKAYAFMLAGLGLLGLAARRRNARI